MLESKIAVVTGGARGIGAAISRRLSAEGHDIAVVDLNADDCAETVKAVEAAGQRAIAIAANVADPDAVKAAFDTIASKLGTPAVLVNNAGIIRDNLIFRMSLEDWDAVMAVHMRGTFLMSQAAQAYMTKAGFGRIINLSSTSALGNRGQANYAAAKAGIQGFTKTLAIELGKFGVTVNAVAPGFIQTEMTAATAKRIGISFDEFLETVAKQSPAGRAGQPEDIANAVAFFASESSNYVSGQVLYVSGGPND